MSEQAARESAELAAWRRNQDQPWNRLRYLLVAANLQRLMDTGAAWRVLDVGAGDGRDALPLAQRGHTVLLLDRSAAMLTEAKRCAAELGVSSCIRTRQVDVTTQALPGAPDGYDLVLCHNVLQYLPEPTPLLGAMAQVLRPGGWLSLLIPNPAAETLRLALQQHDLSAALDSLTATTHRNHFYGVEMHLRTLPAWFDLLNAAGFEAIDYIGVRCVNDYIHDDAVKFGEDGFPQLLALERALGVRSPYRDIARLWQITARRATNDAGGDSLRKGSV